MKRLTWSDHALERLSERFAARGGYAKTVHDVAEKKLNDGDYEEYYEHDWRKHRGEVKGESVNIVVESAFRGEAVFLVLRHTMGNAYNVCSVLTKKQYDNNRNAIWRPKDKPGATARVGEPLRAYPFAGLFNDKDDSDD